MRGSRPAGAAYHGVR